jgi:hypothetical protein
MATVNLDRADNDINKIQPELVKFVNELIKELKLKNFDFRIFEGYRTNARQDYLYNVKKTTKLKAGQSKHNKLPSEALSLVEYKKNIPTWGGYALGSDFKKIVNNLLINYPKISWGGNWTSPNPYQFEINIVSTPKTISPPQIPPTPAPKPVAIQVPVKTVEVTTKPAQNPNIIEPTPIQEKPKIIPTAIKTEIDNSTVIIIGVGLLAYLFLKK